MPQQFDNRSISIPFLFCFKAFSNIVPFHNNQPNEKMYVSHYRSNHNTFTFLHLGLRLLLEVTQSEIYLSIPFPKCRLKREMKLSVQFPYIMADKSVVILK